MGAESGGGVLPQHLFDMFFLRFACWMVWKLFQTNWNEVKNRDPDDFPILGKDPRPTSHRWNSSYIRWNPGEILQNGIPMEMS